MSINKKMIEEGVSLILEGIGEDTSREGLIDTPKRVAKMYEEILAGFSKDPIELLEVTYSEQHDEMILLKNIPLYSMCEHHLLPFHGQAHVAYIPGTSGRVVGLSKISRLVEVVARRLQLQERLTTTIAESIVKALDPKGVLVVIEAEHMCMSMRGVLKPGITTTTSAVRGIFRDSDSTRSEAMSLIRS